MAPCLAKVYNTYVPLLMKLLVLLGNPDLHLGKLQRIVLTLPSRPIHPVGVGGMSASKVLTI
jgi:hypothetical protein